MTRVLWPVALVVLAAAIVVLVLLGRGRSAVTESDEALARGDVPLAIVLAKRAAQARLPGSPYPDQGYERLLRIAKDREAANDLEHARSAYRAVIAAARSTGEADDARADEARAALAKIEGASAPSTPVLPSTPSWARYVLALGVLSTIAGLLARARAHRAGWPLLAVGIAAILIAALS